MIKVIFKNLEKSEIAREAAIERIASVVDKFQSLDDTQVLITLEMENSPSQAGPDLFKVTVHMSGGTYHGLRTVKSASSLYVALADVAEHLLEAMNRFSDKIRVKNRNKSRSLNSKLAKMLRTES